MAILKKLFGNKKNSAEENLDEDEYITDEEVDEIDEDVDLVLEEEESGEDGQLSLDVYEDEESLVIQSTIAGVRPEDLDISVSGDKITIRGERKRENEVHEDDYFYQECYWGSFSRTLDLPVEVSVDEVSAEITDGVLTVTLPKLSVAKTKKVKVKGE